MIFINFKTYEEATGGNAVNFVKIVNEYAKESGLAITIAVQLADLSQCVHVSSDISIWAQHIDAVEFGHNTGAVLPESVLASGGKGTFLNHSEHKFSENNFNKLENAIKRCKELGLKTLVFASNIEELKKVANLQPDFISYEPPELIASKDSSVASQPEIVQSAAEISEHAGIPLIVGAGIKNSEDVRICLEKGAKGIAVSSSIVLSDDPVNELGQLAKEFLK